MKITYVELQSESQILQSLTGLTPGELEALLVSFEVAWSEFGEAALGKTRLIEVA